MRLHLFDHCDHWHRFAASRGSPAQAQSAALAGQVSSAAEPAMEGVLVSAKKADSTVTVTVVSDGKGRYSFPADRLEPGRYTISIRAIGYKLDGPKTRRRRGRRDRHRRSQAQPGQEPRAATVQRRMAQQPAGRAQAEGIPHHVRRLPHPAAGADVDHSPAEFEQVFLRMSRYSPGSTPTHPQPLLPGPRGERPAVTGDAAKAAAEYLASLSARQRRGDRIPVQAAAASEGPRHPRHRHRIRPAAQRGAAARRHRRCRRQGLVLRLRPPVRRRARSQDRHGEGHRRSRCSSPSSPRAGSISSSIRRATSGCR